MKERDEILERHLLRFPVPPTLTLDRVARRRDRKRRNRKVLTAVMALILAIVATVAVVRVFRTNQRVVPAGIDVRDLIWSKVTANDATFGASSMSGVVAGGPGFVAVGGLSNGISAPSSFGSGYVWVSADGSSWRRLPETFGQGLVDVAAGGPGFVAIGGDESGPTVFTSSDGTHWTRAGDGDSVFGHGARLSAVTAGGPGLVAVGTHLTDRAGRGRPGGGVWTSTDGTTWQPVPDQRPFADPFSGLQSTTDISGVTDGPNGLVAVGSDSRGTSDSGRQAAVWTSQDGITWTKVEGQDSVLTLPGGSAMTQVVAGGPGYVAVGWRGAAETLRDPVDAAVWTSVDGSSWRLASADDGSFAGPDGQGINGIAATANGLVAVGYESSNSAAVWTSPNGSEWTRVSNDGGMFGNDHGSYMLPGQGDYVISQDVAVAPDGSSVVAVGEEYKAARAAVWVGR